MPKHKHKTTTLTPRGGLVFSFPHMLEEITAISQVSSKYIWKQSEDVLLNLKTQLENIREQYRVDQYAWRIPESSPLCTIPSQGQYDRRGEHVIFGQITSVWEITPLRDPHWRNTMLSQEFALTGIASTKVRIFRGEPDNRECEFATWTMEVGDANSPGCHFHVHVSGPSDEPPFPSFLPVPRFPGILFTPMEVFEYVLGELFQKDWGEEAARETDPMRFWASHQKKRLTNLLGWQQSVLRDCTGSPWAALKRSKPEPDQLTREVKW